MSSVSKGRSNRTSEVSWSRLPLVLAALALLLMVAHTLLTAPARSPVAMALAVIGLAALALVLQNGARTALAARRASRLAAALEADPRGRLIVDGDGNEVWRNGLGRALLGPAGNPTAPFAERAAGDERALDDLKRLDVARPALQRAEVVLTAASGEREWYLISVQPVQEPAGGRLWTVEEVTPRRALEETLRREHERLADFLDLSPVGYYSADAEGEIRFVNQRLAEWLGVSATELVGRNLAEVFGTVPDPETPRAELRLRGRGGEVFQAFVAHSVFDEGDETFTRSVVVRDLMPERHLERAVRAAERRFRWLFDDAPMAIALVDLDQTISGCNAAFLSLVRRPSDEVIGRAVLDVVTPDDRSLAEEQLARVLMAQAPAARLEVRLGARSELAANCLVSPAAEEGGAVSGLVLHLVDTTERKNLEIQFAQSQKIQAMGQLAGGVAHDFNNLLTAMIGFCDLLLQRHGPGDPSFADVMQIKQNANRAAALVRQLLAFSRKQALQPRLLDVTDALAELSGLLHRLLGETTELRMVHGRDLGLIRVDPGQFDQVIINLAVNARDAMPGGGTLTVTTSVHRLDRAEQRGSELMPPGEYVRIDVSDTGVGIAQENLDRIFEPFFSTKEVGAGTGLGLSTVYGILRQTDGFILVDSTPGQGATFSILLPRHKAEVAQPARKAEAPAAVADLTGAGSILLVEDEDAVRLFAARALRNKGYEVTEARSAEQALDQLKDGLQPDVLISDVVMPGMDGPTLARLVQMERPGVRIILMSGYSEDTAVGEAAASEGIAFMPKPFSLKQLAETVKDAMERSA